MLLTHTMLPAFSCTMCGMAARQQLKAPPTFTAKMRFHSSSVMSVSSPLQAMPALLTSKSTPPTRSNISRTWRLSATSHCTASLPSSAARASALSLLVR